MTVKDKKEIKEISDRVGIYCRICNESLSIFLNPEFKPIFTKFKYNYLNSALTMSKAQAGEKVVKEEDQEGGSPGDEQGDAGQEKEVQQEGKGTFKIQSSKGDDETVYDGEWKLRDGVRKREG